MDKQEAMPYKLLFSRKGTNFFSIDFNISQSLLMMRKIMVIPLFIGEWTSLFAAIRRFLYYILALSIYCSQISW